MEIDRLPDGLFMLGFEPPGILTGEQTPKDGSIKVVAINFYKGPDFDERAQSLSSFCMGSTDDTILTLRMVAKIAHAALYYFFKPEEFKPLLLDIIEGRDTDIFQYVGGGSEGRPTGGDYYTLEPCQKGPWIVIRTGIFANLGIPAYEVVAGLRTGGAIFR